MNLVEAAAAFAEKAHAGQTRKFVGGPYIGHPARVALEVSKIRGATPEMVAAAWLHDVVEDTDVGLGAVRDLFGDGVADLVGWLTNASRGMDLPRAERKAIDRAHLAEAPAAAKVIKMLDRLDNLSEMRGAPQSFRRIYGKESLLLAEAVGDADPDMKDKLIAAAAALVASTRRG